LAIKQFYSPAGKPNAEKRAKRISSGGEDNNSPRSYCPEIHKRTPINAQLKAKRIRGQGSGHLNAAPERGLKMGSGDFGVLGGFQPGPRQDPAALLRSK